MALEGHTNEVIYLLGIVNFEFSIFEQEIEKDHKRFKTKSTGPCKVEIYGSEGAVPHMHVFSLDKKFHACVCLYSNHYFAHGGHYEDKFTSKQSKEFNDWLKQKNTKAPNNMTNWEAAVFLWEVANPDCKFPENSKVKVQPHYENMVDYKSK